MSSDNQLMDQVKSGDFDKMGLLFERHKLPLFGYFYRQTGNRHHSEDLVQTVFMRMLKYRHTFEGYAKFTTWMYAVARNAAFDHFKKNKKYRPMDKQPPDHAEAPHQEDDLIRDERIALLNEAMNRLAPEKKEILVLSKFQGLKYEDIGKILDCTEGAVKVRVFRAMQELKEMYSRLEGS